MTLRSYLSPHGWMKCDRKASHFAAAVLRSYLSSPCGEKYDRTGGVG